MKTDLKVNNGVSAVKVPESDVVALATVFLARRRRGGHEVPVGSDDKRGAALVRRHAPHVGGTVAAAVVVDDEVEGRRSSTPGGGGSAAIVDVEDDDVTAGGGVDEQQSHCRGVRRHGQLQQAAVLVERQHRPAGARRDVPHVDAEAADVAVAAVARRQTVIVLDERQSNVGRHRHTVHRTFVHLSLFALMSSLSDINVNIK